MNTNYQPGDRPVPGIRLDHALASGSFGTVWQATAPGGTKLAIKIILLNKTHCLKELRALKLVRNVRHANIVPLVGFWLKDASGDIVDLDQLGPEELHQSALTGTLPSKPRSWVPRELVVAMGLGDKSLFDRLEECRAQGLTGLPIHELLNHMDDISRAIDFLNESRHAVASSDTPVAIQHCDIKPQNILLVGGSAQLCDLGLARVLDESRATKMSFTAAYGAPECITGTAPSHSTDQYSLAISYHELRTGELPFPPDMTPGSVIHAHVHGELDLTRLSGREREVIEKATSRDPSRRFSTTQEMVVALRSSVASRASWKRSSSRQGGGKRQQFALTAATLFATAISLGSIYRISTSAPASVATLRTVGTAASATIPAQVLSPSTPSPSDDDSLTHENPAGRLHETRVRQGATDPTWLRSQILRAANFTAKSAATLHHAMPHAVSTCAAYQALLVRRLSDVAVSMINAPADQRDRVENTEWLRLAISLDPDNSAARVHQGRIHAHARQFEQAIRSYTKAIELASDASVAYRLRGIAHMIQGDLPFAAADLKACIEQNPNDLVALRMRSLVRLSQGDYLGAVKDQKRVRDTSSSNLFVLPLRIREAQVTLNTAGGPVLMTPHTALELIGVEKNWLIVSTMLDGEPVLGSVRPGEVRPKTSF